MTAEILFRLGASDLRMGHDAIAAQAAEVLDAMPAPFGVALEEPFQPVQQLANDAGADGVIEHRRGADLHGAAAEQEVVQRVRELSDSTDAGKFAIGKRLSHLRHL